MFRFIDLFSGCGGLTLGLESAGGQSVLAVEKSDMAANTYFENFVAPRVPGISWHSFRNLSTPLQARAGLAVSEVGAVLEDDEIDLRTLEADVVVGGPPCQGFSLAGRRNPDDARNQLPWHFLRFVERLSPKAVVIENVVGMSRSFTVDQSPFEQLQRALSDTRPGYVVQGVEVNALHYGAPQHRPRLMVIGVRRDVAASQSLTTIEGTWRSGFSDELLSAPPSLAPLPTMLSREMRTVDDAIGDLSDREPGRSSATYHKDLDSLSRRRASDSPYPPNHVERKHSDRVKNRFRVYQWLAANGMSHRVLAAVNGDDPARRAVAIKELNTGNFPAMAPDGTRLASSQAEMVDLIERLSTRKHSQKALVWDAPGKTVVTLPDDYVHPSEPRTLTVRELARLQGFPDSFTFHGRETTGAHRRRFETPQYSQVGNAVSPFLARAVGLMLTAILDAYVERHVA